MKILVIIWGLLMSIQVDCQLAPRFKSWDNNEFIITASLLNIRESNGIESKVVDQISIGTKVISFETTISAYEDQKSPQFHKIQYKSNSEIREGYASASYLSQYFVYDRDDLFLLKEVIRDGKKYIKVLLVKDSSVKEIGKFETGFHQNYSISIRHTKLIQGVSRIIEVERELFDTCSSPYSNFTYTEMDDGSYKEVPNYSYDITESGESVLDLQLPSDPYGNKNRINIIETKFAYDGNGTRISEIKVIQTYKWNGTEWISE